MDKIKPVIAAIFTHRFWIMCGISTVLCLTGWYLASGKLKTEREENQSTWNSAFSKGDSTLMAGVAVGNRKVHPNEISYVETEKVIAKLRESVYRAWDIHYQHQGEDIFVWPQALPNSFLKVVEKLRPIESKAKYSSDPRDELINIDDRETYRDYIKVELPNLAKIIHATWANPEYRIKSANRKPASESKKSPTDNAKDVSQLVVEWDSSNQNYVTKLFDWSGSLRNAPSTLEVLYAQEDLWLLTSIMHVIKNTNGESDAPHNAIIKKVHSILLGRAASNNASGMLSVQPGARGNSGNDTGGEEGGAGEAEFSAGDFENSGQSGGGGGGGANLPYVADPAEGRYVDKEYKPIPADQLRSAAAITDPNKISPLRIAKRMPIRLKVTIDQRRINNLLAECANSPLTIEVNQVRILGSANNSSPSQNDGKGTFPYDSVVEIFGIIYIYNPVPFDLGNPETKDSAGSNTTENANTSG